VTLPPFQLDRPGSLSAALQLRAEGAAAYAGGTELLLAMGIGLLRPDVLADLKRLPELKGSSFVDGVLRVGAGCTHDEVANDPLVLAELPILAKVASKVGNPRVRMQGTIGGNIVFAEPKSDIVPTLISLEGSVELQSPGGTRTITAAEFMVGPYWTDLADDELLVAVSVPIVPGRRVAYEKFQTLGRPSIGVAVRIDADGSTRVVIGSVCEIPHVVDLSSPTEIDPVAIAAEVDITADLTGDVEYKRHVTAVIIGRAVAALEGASNGA
jgi:aerobic carbon-monoxide dehydrogenase medium subunit